MIETFRIVKAPQSARSAFSGSGARIYGGRWNSPGTAMVYTAGSISLAMLEMLVHLHKSQLFLRYLVFSVRFDENIVTTIDPRSLPRGWQSSPPPVAAQAVGDRWILQGSSPILRVPSAVVPDEWNYLINPVHPAFTKITIGRAKRVQFDGRLK
jgi:RES domain-containing protein